MKARCLVCDHDDKWKNVDQYRLKPSGMALCQKCGFVSYPDIIAKKKELEEYYVEDYRGAPTANNYYTGQRKLHYHNAFLKDLFQSWKGKKIRAFEIGAAHGMFLEFLRGTAPQYGYEVEVAGSELTLSMRRCAWHIHKINLSTEFDDKSKWDFISSYKVAEHIVDSDKELTRYGKALSKDGRLYVSVPTWFESMDCFGMTDTWDIEYYYHTNHINTWTKKLWEYVLAKSGFKILKHDGLIYDDTYLCEYAPGNTADVQYWENPDEIEEKMAKIKEADTHFRKNRFKEAIDVFPTFLLAWKRHYEMERSRLHKLGGLPVIKEEILEPCSKVCKAKGEMLNWLADIHMRYNDYETALTFLEASLKVKPENFEAMRKQSDCLRMLGENDPKQKAKYLEQSLQIMKYSTHISKQVFGEALTLAYADSAQLPCPQEG